MSAFTNTLLFWDYSKCWNIELTHLIEILFKILSKLNLLSPKKQEVRPLLGKLLATCDFKKCSDSRSESTPAMQMVALNNSPAMNGLCFGLSHYRVEENQAHKVAEDTTKQIHHQQQQNKCKSWCTGLVFELCVVPCSEGAGSTAQASGSYHFFLQKGWPDAHCKRILSSPRLHLPLHKLNNSLLSLFSSSPQKLQFSFVINSSHRNCND